MADGLDIQSNDGLRPFPRIFSAVMIIGFIVATVFTARMAITPVAASLGAKNWITAPAVITSHVLDARDNQYSVKATYSYDLDGQTYTSDSVFFDESVGLRKAYYRRIYRELSRHKTPTNPITVWVNPDNPGEAVIYRHIRWDKFIFACFFCLCFAAFGFGPLWVWYTDRRNKA
ncbi:MAG: DUF3592 domain-containing protein [Litorimonas sp.]